MTLLDLPIRTGVPEVVESSELVRAAHAHRPLLDQFVTDYTGDNEHFIDMTTYDPAERFLQAVYTEDTGRAFAIRCGSRRNYYVAELALGAREPAVRRREIVGVRRFVSNGQPELVLDLEPDNGILAESLLLTRWMDQAGKEKEPGKLVTRLSLDGIQATAEWLREERLSVDYEDRLVALSGLVIQTDAYARAMEPFEDTQQSTAVTLVA